MALNAVAEALRASPSTLREHVKENQWPPVGWTLYRAAGDTWLWLPHHTAIPPMTWMKQRKPAAVCPRCGTLRTPWGNGRLRCQPCELARSRERQRRAKE